MTINYSRLLFIACLYVFISACGGGSSKEDTSNKSLTFAVEPTSSSAMAAIKPAVVVHIFDESGAIDTNAANEVTLSLQNDAVETLIHFSGGGPFVLESIDLNNHEQLAWFESQPDSEIGGMAFNVTDNLLYLTTIRSGNLYTFNYKEDSLSLIGAGGTLDRFKGITFEGTGLNRLLGVTTPESNLLVNHLYHIDTDTGTSTSLGEIVPNTGSIGGFTGLATDPTDNSIYAIAKLDGLGLTGRALMTIENLTATYLGDTRERIAGIAFSSDGTLYAISGERSATPESLFTVNKTTGALTLIKSLNIIQPNSDGEAIGIVPSQLSGTTTVTAVNGIARFNNVKVNTSASGYTLTASATGVSAITSTAFDITEVDSTTGAVTLNSASQTVNEADGSLSVGITIGNIQSHDVVASIAISGSATGAGVDYDLDTNRFFNITIPAGSSTASRSFEIIDDDTFEQEETIIFTLLNASYSTTSPTTVHTVTIVDDD